MFSLRDVSPTVFDVVPKKNRKKEQGRSIQCYAISQDITNTFGANNKLHRTLSLPPISELGTKVYEKSTNRHCMYDRHPIDGVPVGAVLKYAYNTQRTELSVWMWGYFSSWECAYAYVSEQMMLHPTDDTWVNSIKAMKHVYAFLHGEDAKLKPASDWHILKTVGMGKMTIQSYREGLTYLNLEPTRNVHYYACSREFQI